MPVCVCDFVFQEDALAEPIHKLKEGEELALGEGLGVKELHCTYYICNCGWILLAICWILILVGTRTTNSLMKTCNLMIKVTNALWG